MVLPGAGGRGDGEMSCEGYRVLVTLMHSNATIVNNIEYLEFAERVDLKCYYHKKKK